MLQFLIEEKEVNITRDQTSKSGRSPADYSHDAQIIAYCKEQGMLLQQKGGKVHPIPGKVLISANVCGSELERKWAGVLDVIEEERRFGELST